MPHATRPSRQPDSFVGEGAVAVEGALRLEPCLGPAGARLGLMESGLDNPGSFGDLRQNRMNRWMVQQR